MQPQGCFYAFSSDGSQADFPTEIVISNLVPSACISACLARSYTFAAVQVKWKSYTSQHIMLINNYYSV